MHFDGPGRLAGFFRNHRAGWMNACLGANADQQRGVLVVRDIGGDDFAVSKRHCLAILKLGGKRIRIFSGVFVAVKTRID